MAHKTKFINLLRIQLLARLVPISFVMATGVAWADTAPTGSYQKSCQSTEYQQGKLEAQCLTRLHLYRMTSLPDADKCHGDIANINGKLKCFPGPEGGPSGSYLQTCNNTQYNQEVLTANCRKKNGSYALAQLRITSCDGDISNDDGQLMCHGKYEAL